MKWRAKAAVVLMLFMSVLWVACSVCEPDTSRSDGRPLGRVEERILTGPKTYGVYRVHDPQFDVICWVYADFYSGGISCLPDDAVGY